MFTNSGLKGQAAVFARKYLSLEREHLRGTQRLSWPALVEVALPPRIRSAMEKVDPVGQDSSTAINFTAEALQGVTHLIQAVGYAPAALPRLWIDDVMVAEELWETRRLQPREDIQAMGARHVAASCCFRVHDLSTIVPSQLR